ncbi:hypothetical protein GGF41_000259 [Coemansia sp. RSA 2531]|nr:hypothetical protein GGF41_000259 [Coemansia sp. RSA 2531]
MSNYLSPAQALPADVLRSIIKWVVNEKKSPFVEASCQLGKLKELLIISSTWRQAALEFLWKQLHLIVNVPSNDVCLKRPNWLIHNMLPHNAASLAKKIHVLVPMSSIVLGVAHKLLVSYIGSTKCFPFVYNLTVKITDVKDQHYVAKDVAISNAIEFAKLLKSMAPDAKTVNMLCTDDPWRTSSRNKNRVKELDEEILEVLADVLYSNAKRALLDLFQVDVNNLATFNAIPPLSRLRIHRQKSPDMHASLVHKSANTLQYLAIRMHYANMLIYDTNGNAVIYPNLQHLQLSTDSANPTDSNIMITKKVIFPVLRTLRLPFSYPFNDDVLFRGNTATLEYLDARFNHDTILMLNKSLVFESKNKVLRNVKINWPSVDMDTAEWPRVDTNKCFSHLVSAAKILTVSNEGVANVCAIAAQYGQGFQNIKVFDVHSGDLLFSDVICLLNLLPALVELRGGINGLGPEFENISPEELLDYMASIYCGAGRNLQIWRVYSITDRYNINVTNYVLLLALASPRLRRIEIKPDNVKDYHARVTKALESGPYSKYASQFNKLLDVAFW